MDFFKSLIDSKSNRILISLILLDVLLIIMLIFLRNAITEAISAEGYKLLLQLAIITVGGGFISLAFAELKREQESRKATRDYFKTVFSRALKEYNKAKKCRRLLRVNAIYKESEELYLRPDEYNKLMTELEDCQLEFESLSKEMTRDKDQKKVTQTMQHMDILKSLFGQMEQYLGKILSEFEMSNLSKETIAKLSAKKFENVKEFTTPLGEDKEKATRKFKTEFGNPFDKVIKTLVKEISK